MSAARARTRICVTRWQYHTARANSRANSGGKGTAALRGTLTSTAHGASLHHEAAGHGESAHDQEDNARHYSVKGREEVKDAVPWSGRGEALKGPRRTKSSEIDAKLTPNAHALVWGITRHITAVISVIR